MAHIQIVFLLLGLFMTEGKILRMTHGPPPIDVPTNRPASPVWANITQRVDHFNPIDKRTWTMRYLYNDECFVRGGPIFIYLGGEWTIRVSSLMAGTVYDLACEHGGYMFYTEHRYYGRSFPTEDFSTQNLKYLSADQALADIAYFITHQKENNNELLNSTVIAIGGSYSATLATWARIKYPHLVDIAYASSGPLYAKVDFPEYYEVVNENIGLVSSSCLSTVKSAISEVETMLESPEGITNVSLLFQLCQTLNTSEPHRGFFFNNLAEVFAGLVQYARDGEIQYDCNIIQNAIGSNAEKLAHYIRRSYGSSCMGSYYDFLNMYGSTNLSASDSRQWLYQTCSEYGWYQTTTSNNQPFGSTFPIDLYYQICEDLFGEEFDEDELNTATRRTNVLYGSVGPEITRLISFHGSVDPWHPLGILEDLHSSAVAFYVNGTSHCADLQSISDSDSQEMRQAKVAVKETIATWLNEIRNGTISGSSSFYGSAILIALMMLLTIKS